MDIVISTKNLSYSIPERILFEHIDIQIFQGDFIVLTGVSGCGKSTLLKILAGLESPTTGDIFFLGKNILDYNIPDYRKRVSYCFQSPQLFGETVYDDLYFPFQIRNMPFDKTLVDRYVHLFNLNMDIIHHSVRDLSGGEKQRVALIRNLLFDPMVLLMDEVTSNLDLENKVLIRNAIKDYQQRHQTTVLWVTHDTAEIADAHQVWIMDKEKLEVKNDE